MAQGISLLEGVMVALFVMALVIGLLGAIYLLIKISSFVIQRYFGKAARN